MNFRKEPLKNTVAIVQARLGSSRLPLKSLLCLRGRPVVDWIFHRLKKAVRLDAILVAIPNTNLDDALAVHLEDLGASVYRGPEEDVLSRLLGAANKAQASHVVRICADNPLVSPKAIDALINFYETSDVDYAYNHIPRANLWPDGLGGEIVSRSLLEYMGEMAQKSQQREHCMNFIWDNPHKFRIGTFNPTEQWLQRPDLKLDIDTRDDFLKIASFPIHPDMEDRELISAIG